MALKKPVLVSIAANALLQRATAVIRPPVQKKASRNALFGLLTRFTGLLSVEPHWPQNLASGGPSHPQPRHVRVCSVTLCSPLVVSPVSRCYVTELKAEKHVTAPMSSPTPVPIMMVEPADRSNRHATITPAVTPSTV